MGIHAASLHYPFPTYSAHWAVIPLDADRAYRLELASLLPFPDMPTSTMFYATRSNSPPDRSEMRLHHRADCEIKLVARPWCVQRARRLA
jgi:hypothetical protein